MNPVAEEYCDETSRALDSMDNVECVCIQTKLKRSVIISLGNCLAFVGF